MGDFGRKEPVEGGQTTAGAPAVSASAANGEQRYGVSIFFAEGLRLLGWP